MTGPMMELRAVVEKVPDADILRSMIGFAAQRLMKLEVAAMTGAARCERSPSALRSATANGLRPFGERTQLRRGTVGPQFDW